MADQVNRIIRPSSLVTWLDCPRRWATGNQGALIADAGYRLQPKRPAHVGAVVGGAVHAAAAYTLSVKAATGEIGNASEAEDRAMAEFTSRVEQDGLTLDGTSPNTGIAQRQIARMTKAYRHYIAPETTPLLIEQRLEAEAGGGWIVSGQADVLAGNPDTSIDDLKTGTQRRANAVQYGAYFIIFSAHDYRPTSIREQFVRRSRIDKEQERPQTFEMALSFAVADAMDAVDAIKDGVDRFVARVRGEDPSHRPPPTAFPANPNSPLCGEKWCAAFGTDFCHAHKKGV